MQFITVILSSLLKYPQDLFSYSTLNFDELSNNAKEENEGGKRISVEICNNIQKISVHAALAVVYTHFTI